MGISLRLELCQHVLDKKRMLNTWQESVLVSIFKGKVDVRSSNACRGVKLLRHAMKIIERALERKIQELVNVYAV